MRGKREWRTRHERRRQYVQGSRNRARRQRAHKQRAHHRLIALWSRLR